MVQNTSYNETGEPRSLLWAFKSSNHIRSCYDGRAVKNRDKAVKSSELLFLGCSQHPGVFTLEADLWIPRDWAPRSQRFRHSFMIFRCFCCLIWARYYATRKDHETEMKYANVDSLLLSPQIRLIRWTYSTFTIINPTWPEIKFVFH